MLEIEKKPVQPRTEMRPVTGFELPADLEEKLKSRQVTIDERGMEAAYEPPGPAGLRYISFEGKRVEVQQGKGDDIEVTLRSTAGDVVEKYSINAAGLVIREQVN